MRHSNVVMLAAISVGVRIRNMDKLIEQDLPHRLRKMKNEESWYQASGMHPDEAGKSWIYGMELMGNLREQLVMRANAKSEQRSENWENM